mgnify:CR=1 FL=1
MEHWHGAFVETLLRKTPPERQLTVYRQGSDPRWRCDWCWAWQLVGPALSERMGQLKDDHLFLDREPRSCADERFATIKKDRFFRCDAPRCTNGGRDGTARVGDWLYDENNLERFRASNLIRGAGHAGRVGQRGTFVLRD